MRPVVNWLVVRSEELAHYFAWLPPLFARVVAGWVFMWSGWAKLHNLPQMIQNFTEWCIPYPEIMTPLASGIEFVGGLLLLLGLFTRIAAPPLVVVMIVAIVSAKWDQIDSFESLAGFDEVLYVALFGWLAVAGAGPVSLDHLLKKWWTAEGSGRLAAAA